MSLSLDFRELTSTVSLTSSWDDLSLHDEPMVTDVKRPKSFNEPLHIFTSPMAYSSSPSPTRLAKVYKSTAVVISYYYRPQRSWGKYSVFCPWGGHAWLGGGVRGRYYEMRSMSGRYAFYWNAFLLVIILAHYLLSVLIGSGVYCFYQFQQCFSPSLQQPIRNNTLTPSPSPSPTRKTFVR